MPQGIVRKEYEYEIPYKEAKDLLELCEPSLIEKTRYLVHAEGKVWELDVFKGANEGLVIAELELETEDELFGKPSWLGEEVSYDPRYINSNLAKHPFKQWK